MLSRDSSSSLIAMIAIAVKPTTLLIVRGSSKHRRAITSSISSRAFVGLAEASSRRDRAQTLPTSSG
jgi:hypothetical protein